MIIPAKCECSFLDVIPRIVSIKKKVKMSSKINEGITPPDGNVSPKVCVVGNIRYNNPLAKKAPSI